ncbi:MAG: OmpA family protein [Sphingobacteriaceae bacterium]
MNHSTFKKAVAFSMFLMLGFTAISTAQQSTSNGSTTPKLFGGREQYRTWSVGFNAGVLSPGTFFIGTKDYHDADINLGYGLSVHKQLGHSFGIEGSILKGKVSGRNEEGPGANGNTNKAFETKLGWSASVMGVLNVVTIDFLKRENAVNLLLKGGVAYSAFSYKITNSLNTVTDYEGTYGANGNKKYARGGMIPVGAGLKFKVSNRVNFNIGYNTYVSNTDGFDGTPAGGRDTWSYAYGGLELTLGNPSKPSLYWANPVAIMYDELKDPTLREEVEALKSRVTTLETADLLKDTDGDGVADKLDKCPGTEAGVKVDGSGCPLDVDADGVPDSKDNCPTEKGTAELNGCPATPAAASSIQFEFNSSVLKTSAYPALDELSADLRTNTDKVVELDGHASEEGTEAYNMQLSKDRANSVKTYLVNSGVEAKRITTKGFGETRPVASNTTEEGRQLNRRVEIVK